MNWQNYRRALFRIGLTQAGAARFFDINPRTSRRWATGDADVPRTIEIVLWLMQKFEVKPGDIPPPTNEEKLEDEFYQRTGDGPIAMTRPEPPAKQEPE